MFFKCFQPWTPGHKCAKGKAQYIEVFSDDDEYKGLWMNKGKFQINRRHRRQQLKKKNKNKIILHWTKQEWKYFQQCLVITLFDARVWHKDKEIQFL